MLGRSRRVNVFRNMSLCCLWFFFFNRYFWSQLCIIDWHEMEQTSVQCVSSRQHKLDCFVFAARGNAKATRPRVKRQPHRGNIHRQQLGKWISLGFCDLYLNITAAGRKTQPTWSKCFFLCSSTSERSLDRSRRSFKDFIFQETFFLNSVKNQFDGAPGGRADKKSARLATVAFSSAIS